MEDQVEITDHLIEPCLLTMKDIETELDLPAGFTKAFLKLDDWTFVVKGWAYVESILELLIWSKLDYMPNEFRKVISRIDSGSMKTGKLAFAKALELVGPKEWKFLQSFCEYRNLVAHGIGNIQFDFMGFISSQEDKAKKEFFKKFESCNCCGIQGHLFKDNKNVEHLTQHPREYVMAGYYDVLHCLSNKLEHKAFRKIRNDLHENFQQKIAEFYRKLNENWKNQNNAND
jgi:hypothetical protein